MIVTVAKEVKAATASSQMTPVTSRKPSQRLVTSSSTTMTMTPEETFLVTAGLELAEVPIVSSLVNPEAYFNKDLHPASCTLHPAPCTMHHAPCTMHPAPCNQHPAP